MYAHESNNLVPLFIFNNREGTYTPASLMHLRSTGIAMFCEFCGNHFSLYFCLQIL